MQELREIGGYLFGNPPGYLPRIFLMLFYLILNCKIFEITYDYDAFQLYIVERGSVITLNYWCFSPSVAMWLVNCRYLLFPENKFDYQNHSTHSTE